MFEGIEKKFEVLVSEDHGSLRELGLPFWKRVIGKANATVLSTESNDVGDAYLLSESSLFVYDRRAIMITCGKTTLVNAVEEMLEGIPASAIESFIFERKNENFPHLQLSTFDEDVYRLQSLLPGTALRFGDPEGHHLSLYHLDRPFDPADDDTTLEILMYGLEDEVRKVFQELEGHDEARKRFRERTARLLPGFAIDDHFFDPYGYSMNAIRESTYATVHVTPENPGSYASFETNVRFSPSELNHLVALVVTLFSPDRFDLVSFQEEVAFRGLAGKYHLQDEEVRELGCGYRLQFSHFGRRTVPEGKDRASTQTTSAGGPS